MGTTLSFWRFEAPNFTQRHNSMARTCDNFFIFRMVTSSRISIDVERCGWDSTDRYPVSFLGSLQVRRTPGKWFLGLVPKRTCLKVLTQYRSPLTNSLFDKQLLPINPLHEILQGHSLLLNAFSHNVSTSITHQFGERWRSKCACVWKSGVRNRQISATRRSFTKRQKVVDVSYHQRDHGGITMVEMDLTAEIWAKRRFWPPGIFSHICEWHANLWWMLT